MSESGFETSSLEEVEAVLDGMENPTSEDVWHATLPYSDRAVASVAAARAGSGGSISLLGPFAVSFDTPGFVNPANNGIDTIALPAGTLLLDVIPLATSEWVGAVPHDQMPASVLASPSGSGPPFATFSLLSDASYLPVALVANYIEDSGIQGGSVEAVDWSSQKRPVLAVEDCHIVLAAYPAGSITAGSLDLYALIAAT